MTTPKQAALAYWQYAAGETLGGKIADSFIEQFPNGFDDTRCAQLAAEAKRSLAEALAVIPKRHRDEFSIGYGVGMHSAISKHREQLILRAVYQDKQVV
ncbi:hypothetical protein QCM80_30175 [Bradyrhizobium sp. SSUT112]|uniref:hypothetical protein n=1 Tax=Bradyrhizobium sp. SSUT112 TaxID=3040604 RepID=UPI002446E905|nr:hypothetical protein [Bradyrhizobium sp. SSUT112]MDH2354903.1 hypothetical protein [Bradyrhizobium sp. SSUT112]